MDSAPKVLVATADYPNNQGSIAMMFVHTRNKYYLSQGIDVTVLNFAAKQEEVVDGIPVISLESYKKNQSHYDILICHAPNLRNHFLFLKKFGKCFDSFMFFFHGHEVMRINQAYSEPYPYVKPSRIKLFLQDIYDTIKLTVWRRFYPKVAKKSLFVFVSHWMLDEFVKWTRIPLHKIQKNVRITYNCIGKAFEDAEFDCSTSKEYDFFTIRGNLDGSKYAIDIVNRLAKNNPKLTFLVVGRGQYFHHDPKADNIIWKNQTMTHDEIIACANASRCALMPTRTDAQGLMACELASLGMPLITSNIDVCHEVFEDFPNISYISNETPKIDLAEYLTDLEKNEPYSKNTKYYNRNTSQVEIEMILDLYKRKGVEK